MIVAVTGHTSGIGKAYFDLCKARGFQVRGYSRSTGHDIKSTTVQQQIVDESCDCDVFINNAHDGFAQTELFSRVWSAWKNENKIIICTGSHVTVHRSYPSGSHHELGCAHYAAQKSALETAVAWAWNENADCHVCLVRPSLTETGRGKNMKSQLTHLIPMDPIQIADFVLHSVLNVDFRVREILIAAQKKNKLSTISV